MTSRLNLFPFGLNLFEVLNGNVSIVSDCHLGNVSNDLSNTILHKIMLIPFGILQCFIRIGTSSIGIGLEDGLSFKNLLPFDPNILCEVVLVQNLSVRGKNGNGEAFAIDIDSKNILLLRKFNFFLGKISDNLNWKSDHRSCKPIHFQGDLYICQSCGSWKLGMEMGVLEKMLNLTKDMDLSKVLQFSEEH